MPDDQEQVVWSSRDKIKVKPLDMKGVKMERATKITLSIITAILVLYVILGMFLYWTFPC